MADALEAQAVAMGTEAALGYATGGVYTAVDGALGGSLTGLATNAITGGGWGSDSQLETALYLAWNKPRPDLFVQGTPVLVGGSYQNPIVSQTVIPALQTYQEGFTYLPDGRALDPTGGEWASDGQGNFVRTATPTPWLLYGGIAAALLFLFFVAKG